MHRGDQLSEFSSSALVELEDFCCLFPLIHRLRWAVKLIPLPFFCNKNVYTFSEELGTSEEVSEGDSTVELTTDPKGDAEYISWS